MKHTRRPVEYMVAEAKNMPSNVILPIVRLTVNRDGIQMVNITDKHVKSETVRFCVDAISYGVQDLVYTRVFSMIIVTDDTLDNGVPFECHSFVCESKDQARRITYALAACFQDYGKRVKADGKERAVRKFAIDLRTPEEQAAASDGETEA
ncbi:unnamed protein product [Acanthoscelides obtectus]|nr:unnamed protein product [Acanthoscelides obtectus]CAK1658589.1 hypothetical protein AOBTE_LOCUS21007 [Acanthoscelides obtectus]